MTILPIRKDLSFLYTQSNVLSPPSEKYTFKVFLDRIALFDRDSVICGVGQVLWKLYRNDDSNLVTNDEEKIEAELIESLGPLIVSLACSACDLGGKPMTGADLRILCWELHEVPDPITESTLVPTLNSSIEKTLEGFDRELFPGSVKPQDYDRIRALHFRARHCRISLNHRITSMVNLVHSWGIHCELRNLIGEKVSDKIEQTSLGTPGLQFLRVSFAILSLAGQDKITNSGFVPLEFQPLTDNLRDKWKITKEDFSVVALRLSKALDTLSISKACSEHTGMEILDPAVSFLLESPLVELREHASSQMGKVVLPCPRAFFSVMSRFLSSTSIRKDLIPTSLKNQNLASLRGIATENFIKKIIPKTTKLIWADDLEIPQKKKGHTIPKPDLLWSGGRFEILIEIKFDVRPNYDLLLLKIDSLLKTWGELSAGIKQMLGFLSNEETIDFIENINPNFKKRIPIVLICTTDELATDGTSFVHAAKLFDLFKDSPIRGFALISLTKLIKLLKNVTADVVGEAIMNHWECFDANHAGASGSPNLFKEQGQYKMGEKEIAIQKELFPELDLNCIV